MTPRTHARLAELREKTGKEYGKLVQKLLAIALLETEVECLVERSIQGIDLDVTIAGRRYGFEVKTCEDDEIRLGAKDHEGLKRQIAEGAEPYLVVLGGGLLAEWAFVRYHPGELPTGKNLSVFRLRPYRNRALVGLGIVGILGIGLALTTNDRGLTSNGLPAESNATPAPAIASCTR